jgi:predicted signal transduction protein with EAL and GGDEF domain
MDAVGMDEMVVAAWSEFWKKGKSEYFLAFYVSIMLSSCLQCRKHVRRKSKRHITYILNGRICMPPSRSLMV